MDEVNAVTGVTFSYELPAGCIYNSVLPCLGCEAMRDLTDQPPFEIVRRMQKAFFVDAANVNDIDVICEIASGFDVDGEQLRARMDTTEVRTRTRWGFETSRRYGTQALPSVLFGREDLVLVAGGFIDAQTLTREIDVRLEAAG